MRILVHTFSKMMWGGGGELPPRCVTPCIWTGAYHFQVHFGTAVKEVLFIHHLFFPEMLPGIEWWDVQSALMIRSTKEMHSSSILCSFLTPLLTTPPMSHSYRRLEKPSELMR